MTKLRKSLKEEYAPEAWKQLQSGEYSESDLQRVLENPYDPVDIIAVQGLASTYEWTWTKETDAGDVMWLRDLLPKDLPNARILTFEYGSKWFKDPDHVSLRDCGKKLLKRILQDRSHHQGDMCQTMNKRPIIFIGHSYGGLVIKQALILISNLKPHERNYLDYRSILTSVTGILYLGTPHCGSSFARFGIMKTRLRSAFGNATHPEILRPLELSSKSNDLFDLQEDFERIVNMSCLSGLKTVHFFETKSVEMRVGGLGFGWGWQIGLVVTKESACMGARADCSFTLEANHMEMNKFGSREEENYVAVVGQLKDIYEKSAEIVSERWLDSQLEFNYDSPSSNTELKDLQNWLVPVDKFSHRLQRLKAVVHSSPGTCQWALEHEAISRWMDPDAKLSQRYRTLWIHGKPGSGKSVLSAFLMGALEERMPASGANRLGNYMCPGIYSQDTCAEPHANVPGLAYISLEGQQDVTSAIGNVIHQLIRQRKRDTEVLRAALKFMASTEVLSQFSAVKLLRKVAERLPTTFIIVDGVDECDSSEELLRLLRPLIESTDNIRLLFLSRAEPAIRSHISDRYCEPENMIDIAANNSGDITLFIETQVEQIILRRPNLKPLQTQIVEKMIEYARGMFQWVKLKLHGLEFHGDNEQNALDILGSFPQSLNEVYKKSFDRYYASEYPPFKRKRASQALKWIVCAVRPVRVRELRLVLELEELWANDEVVTRYTATDIFNYCAEVVDRIPDYELERETRELLDPFIEIHETSEGNNVWRAVHVSHLSVSQLLLGGDNFLGDGRYADFAFSEHDVHSFAAMTCLRITASSTNFCEFISSAYSTRPTVTEAETTKDSLRKYAYENWACHLQRCNIPYENPEDLFALALQSLDAGMQASIDTVGGLTDLFGRLDIQRQGDMYLMVAFRDAQSSLAPTATSIEKVLPHIPALAERLKKINKTVKSRQIRRGDSFRRRTTGFHNGQLSRVKVRHCNLEKQILDSVLAAEAFEMTKVYKEMYRPIRGMLSQMQNTSRELRKLAFALGMDPVRQWLDQSVGEGGKNPIAILGQTSYMVDAFSILPVLPKVRNDVMRFEDQFKCDGSHPLFGPMSTVLSIMDSRNAQLPRGFYEEHIEPHLLLEKSEWETVRLGFYLFEQSTNQENVEALRMILYSVLKFPVIESDFAYGTQLPSVIFEQLKPRLLRRRRRGFLARIRDAPRYILPPLAKIIMLICPPAEALFISILREIMVRMMFTTKILQDMASEWKYTLGGIGLYWIRHRFFPNFFRYNTRADRIADLMHVLSNPLIPLPVPKYQGFWKIFWKFFIRGAVFATYFKAKQGALTFPVPVEEKYKRPLKLMDRFLDLIYFEFGIAGGIESVIELFGVAAVLARPSVWTWGSITGAVHSVLVTIMVKELGIIKTLKTLGKYLLTLWVYSKLQKSTILKGFLKNYILPATSSLFDYLQTHKLFTPLTSLTTTISTLYHKLGPSFLIKSIASVTLIYYGSLFYILLDPLRLRRSESSRLEARKAVLRLRNGRADWNERLQWVGLKPMNAPLLAALGLGMYQGVMEQSVNVDGAAGAMTAINGTDFLTGVGFRPLNFI